MLHKNKCTFDCLETSIQNVFLEKKIAKMKHSEPPEETTIEDTPAPTFEPPVYPCWPEDSFDDFDGELNVTSSGRVCQMWNSDYPHISNGLNEDHNYCR